MPNRLTLLKVEQLGLIGFRPLFVSQHCVKFKFSNLNFESVHHSL